MAGELLCTMTDDRAGYAVQVNGATIALAYNVDGEYWTVATMAAEEARVIAEAFAQEATNALAPELKRIARTFERYRGGAYRSAIPPLLRWATSEICDVN